MLVSLHSHVELLEDARVSLVLENARVSVMRRQVARRYSRRLYTLARASSVDLYLHTLCRT